MNGKGILFDKDGTLIDMGSYWFPLVGFIAKLVVEKNTKAFSQELYNKLMFLAGFDEDGSIIPESLVVKGTNRDIATVWQDFLKQNRVLLSENFISDVVAYFAKYYTQCNVVPTTPKLKEIIEAAKNKGYKIGVATQGNYETTQFALEKLGISEFVDDIFSSDRVKNPKPDIDTMVLAENTWGISAKDIVMVGDSKNDMKFAFNAGCKGVYLSDDTELPLGADVVISSLDELEF